MSEEWNELQQSAPAEPESEALPAASASMAEDEQPEALWERESACEAPAEPVYAASAESAYAAPVEPVYAAPAEPVYAAPVGSAYEAPQPACAQPEPPRPQPAGEPRPGRKSPYAPMTSWGMAIELFLMSIPVLGLVLMIVWACGACRKVARRNLARAYLILIIAGIVLAVTAALLLRFVFTDELVRAFEFLFPGYTIRWG